MTHALQRSAAALVTVLAASGLLAPVVDATSPAQTVLGAKAFAPGGTGFGTVKPKKIFNGGDPSGLVQDIRWSRWGTATATGTGKTWIFKPAGGFYPHMVQAELRASRLGHCTAQGPAAYTRLQARVPSRPGGPLGKWFPWSGQGRICAGP